MRRRRPKKVAARAGRNGRRVGRGPWPCGAGHGASRAQEDESGSAEQEEGNDDAGGLHGKGGPPPERPKDGVGPERPFDPGLGKKGQAPGPEGQDEGAEPPGEEGDVVDEVKPKGISGFRAKAIPVGLGLEDPDDGVEEAAETDGGAEPEVKPVTPVERRLRRLSRDGWVAMRRHNGAPGVIS